MPPGSSDPVHPDPFDGTPYRALRRLGSGGMGDVFLVVHRELDHELAAKVLDVKLAANTRFLDRFRLEAQAQARLQHPNIAMVLGFGTTADKRPFIAMEYLRGRTLSDELTERGRVPVAEALGYAAELLSALAAAHDLGIVHRDVKPANLFLCEQPDGRKTLKILDFGIARVLPNARGGAPAPLWDPTTTGRVLGTPRFLSPEGARGNRVDERADVYAAALVLYLLLTGRAPFDHAKDENGMLLAHVEETPEPPSRFHTEPIPSELDRMLLKALEKDPARRYQTAAEFETDVIEVASRLSGPAGWLETTTFDPNALRSENQAVPERATRGSDAESAPSRASSLPSAPRTRGAPGARWVLVLVFLLTAAIASVTIAALMAAAFRRS